MAKKIAVTDVALRDGHQSLLATRMLTSDMLEIAKKYPEYQFEKHKGYGTKLHYEMLEQHGVSEVHRRTFLKKILGE